MSHSHDWIACDGAGGRSLRKSSSAPNPFTRRAALARVLSGAALAAWAGSHSALAQVAFGGAASPAQGAGRDVLVYLFLRGGADGLSIVVPHGDDGYFAARPTLGVRKSLDLDGFFGLHPAMGALLPLYREGHLAAVQAVGSQDRTRSHFEAMATVERGLRDDRATAASGWLGRYLSATSPQMPSPLRAVAWGDLLPDSLRGALDASAISSLDEFRLDLPADRSDAFARGLATMYGSESGSGDAVQIAGRETLSVLKSMQALDPAHYRPENGATYPKNSGLGDGLRQVACLLKADVGLEVACLDRGGWDTHVAQGGESGWLAVQLKDVADSLAAFAQDLGTARLGRVTVVVMTEFGRRVAENSGLGTDHGRASAMLLLGGCVAGGGRVFGRWPGLAAASLEGPGDLPVTTDYRTVLAEVIACRLDKTAPLAAIFPEAGFETAAPPTFLQVVRPA